MHHAREIRTRTHNKRNSLWCRDATIQTGSMMVRRYPPPPEVFTSKIYLMAPKFNIKISFWNVWAICQTGKLAQTLTSRGKRNLCGHPKDTQRRTVETELKEYHLSFQNGELVKPVHVCATRYHEDWLTDSSIFLSLPRSIHGIWISCHFCYKLGY